MSDEAATQTGAEVSAQPEVSVPQKPVSIKDRLKAAMEPPKQEQAAAPVAETESEAPPPKAQKPKATKQEKPAEEEPAEIEAQEEDAPAQLTKLSDLAEQLGLDYETIMDLEASTKIDGKEGSAKLRDLIKSHQLEGHLNQKLMTFAEEKKAFETETSRKVGEMQQQFVHLNAAIQVAQRMLDGELNGINWEQLQQSDPLEFNQKYVTYQQRQAQIKQVADMIGQERAKAEQQAAAQRAAYLQDQSRLLDSKIPEWSDKSVRNKDVAEMAAILNDAYGVTEKELKSEVDHRLIMIARDAAKWQKLQKEKPSILKKVQTAPKLLKPGVQQSKAAQDALIARNQSDRLRSSGKVKDAVPNLKRLLFN